MLLCGSPPYPGSAFLAGSGAGRVGAGLITLAVTKEMHAIYASALHEATFVILQMKEQKVSNGQVRYSITWRATDHCS